MSKSKLPKPKKKDLDWQKSIIKNTEKEKVKLDNPKGKEHFEQLVRKIGQKK
jgi:hypothetical protein